MAVVILSDEADLHAHGVLTYLQERGRPCYLLDTAKYPQHIGLSWQFESGRLEGGLRLPDAVIPWQEIRSIWRRRPARPAAPAYLDERFKAFVGSESEWALNGLWRALDCFWVNTPDAAERAGHKLMQLGVAQQAGLQTPATLLTNDPQAARAFYDRCEGRMIYKLVDSRSVMALPERAVGASGFSTLPFRAGDLARLAAVRHGPHLFQEEIAKALELRITVIGTEIFAVAIHSQEGKGRYDWRLDYAVPHHPYSLPVAIHAAIACFMRALGLIYGAIDMILTPDGRYVFLEVNPDGQFLWLERFAGLPLTATLAELLWRGAL